MKKAFYVFHGPLRHSVAGVLAGAGRICEWSHTDVAVELPGIVEAGKGILSL